MAVLEEEPTCEDLVLRNVANRDDHHEVRGPGHAVALDDPEGTIFFKELQLTLPAEDPDGSRTEPSGRGYFPGKWNGADVTVKDTERYADTGGWGYYNFNHHEPKAPTAKLQPHSECAYCHMASAKKDDVRTQFYPLLDN